MGARVWSLRFAPINPLGLIAQLLARLLDIHSRLSKLLMLGRLTSCWSAAANRAGWSWMLSIYEHLLSWENHREPTNGHSISGKFAFCHSSTSMASVVFRKSAQQMSPFTILWPSTDETTSERRAVAIHRDLWPGLCEGATRPWTMPWLTSASRCISSAINGIWSEGEISWNINKYHV